MLLRIPENRIAITKYLNRIDEDSFIEEFVIPFFQSYGFQVYRINQHGPGEHGKDIIFARYVPLFLDSEYVSVQAKAETVKASNVSHFAHQLNRALKVPFPSRSGQGELLPNSAVFLNARKHTNDATREFSRLLDTPQFVRILSQENICDLILDSGIGPAQLISKLSQSGISELSEQDRFVYDILMNNEPRAVEQLFDYQLELIRHNISPSIKEMVIDAILLRWRQDPSWVGTVKPMMWLDRYFDFFTERQSPYLLDIIGELTSSAPSFKAASYTYSVVKKITPQMLAPQAEEFSRLCAEMTVSYGRQDSPLVWEKLRELDASGLVNNPETVELIRKTLRLVELRSGKGKEYRRLRTEIADRH